MNLAKRGEVWFVNLGLPKEDHEQAGRRPVVILQTDDLSPLSTVVINHNGTQGRQVVGLKNHDGAPSRLLVVLFRKPEIDKPNLTTFRQVHGRSSCASPSA